MATEGCVSFWTNNSMCFLHYYFIRILKNPSLGEAKLIKYLFITPLYIIRQLNSFHMQLFVKVSDGKSITIQPRRELGVSQVKQLLAERLGK